MKLYKVVFWDNKINEIEISKMNDKSYWTVDKYGKEHRNAIKTESSTVYEYWHVAKNALILYNENKVHSFREALRRSEEKLIEAKLLKQ